MPLLESTRETICIHCSQHLLLPALSPSLITLQAVKRLGTMLPSGQPPSLGCIQEQQEEAAAGGGGGGGGGGSSS